MNDNAKKRLAVLEVLYKARELRPMTGYVHIDNLPDDSLSFYFTLEVLEELGFVKAHDSDESYMITGAGVLACEQGQGEC